MREQSGAPPWPPSPITTMTSACWAAGQPRPGVSSRSPMTCTGGPSRIRQAATVAGPSSRRV